MLPFTTTKSQRSAKLPEQPAASAPRFPTETQNHLFLSFPFSSSGGFQSPNPSWEPFKGEATAPSTR